MAKKNLALGPPGPGSNAKSYLFYSSISENFLKWSWLVYRYSASVFRVNWLPCFERSSDGFVCIVDCFYEKLGVLMFLENSGCTISENNYSKVVAVLVLR